MDDWKLKEAVMVMSFKPTTPYIEFIKCGEKPKTNGYAVYNKEHAVVIARIKWYGPWRKYCFFPVAETIFSSDCIKDIYTFMDKLMELRK